MGDSATAEVLQRFFPPSTVVGRERSLKISRSRLMLDRCMIGVRAESATLARFRDFAGATGMPSEYLDQLITMTPQSDHLHVGLESDGQRLWCKVYLEFDRNYAEARRAKHMRQRQLLLYLAFKWECDRPELRAISRYSCCIGINHEEIVGRVERFHTGQTSAVRRLIMAALEATRSRASPPMYLETCEDGNPRLSYDLNFYGSGLKLSGLRSQFEYLDCQCSLDGRLLTEIEPVCDRFLGHLSAGVDRFGEEFLTVYFPENDAVDARLHHELC